MIVAARIATRDDLGVMAEMAEAGVAEQAEARGGSIWRRRETRSEPYEVSLHAALLDPEYELWVGTIDETVIGYAVARVEAMRDGAVLGVVEDVYVDPGAREVGVGEALLDEVVRWCEQRGCVGIDALALPGNRSTKNFFETFGFKARLLTVHRDLS